VCPGRDHGPHFQLRYCAMAESSGFGGKPDSETWMADSIGLDPVADVNAQRTAENVAEEYDVTREESDTLPSIDTRNIWTLCE